MGTLFDLSPEGREPPAEADRTEGRPQAWGAARCWRAGYSASPLSVAAAGVVPRRFRTSTRYRRLACYPGSRRAGESPPLSSGRSGAADPVVGQQRPRPAAHVVQRADLAPPPFRFRPASAQRGEADQEHHGCTVNDVIVSICAGAVRRWLDRARRAADQPLVAQVPVVGAQEEQTGTFGNRILLMTAPLYTNVADPFERLQRTHEALGRDEGAAQGAAGAASRGR